MKILITGTNIAQCVEDYFHGQNLKVIPSHYSLLRCLRDMGHEVTQTRYDMARDQKWDVVILFLSSPTQFVSRNFYQGLEALHEQKNVILAFDDWQMPTIISDIQKFIDNPFRSFLTQLQDRSVEELERSRDIYIESANKIISRSLPLLVSAFDKGDLSLLIEWNKDKLFRYNPNPYHHNRTPGDRLDTPRSEMSFFEDSLYPEGDFVQPENKARMFNFASLVQSATRGWLKKQDIRSWEIEFFGSKAEKQRRLTEADMVKVFAEQWGCLMPGYFHAGSGWWRARPLQVADAGSILIGDPKEMMVYYQDEELANLKAHEIEDLSTKELVRTAARQKEAIYDNHPLDKNTQKAELEACLQLF